MSVPTDPTMDPVNLLAYAAELRNVHSADLSNCCVICRATAPCTANLFARYVQDYMAVLQRTPEAASPEPQPVDRATLVSAAVGEIIALLPPPGAGFDSQTDLAYWLQAIEAVVHLTYGPDAG